MEYYIFKNKLKLIEKQKPNFKFRKAKIKVQLLILLKYLKNMNLTIYDILNNNVFSKHPYDKPRNIF